jgi:hypothetical protein
VTDRTARYGGRGGGRRPNVDEIVRPPSCPWAHSRQMRQQQLLGSVLELGEDDGYGVEDGKLRCAAAMSIQRVRERKKRREEEERED